MSAGDAPVPIATLLTHRDWVRRLARSLVHDEATADDIEQRTWLTALRSPPRSAASARAWLSRVVRTQALDRFRVEARRDVHERAGARGETIRSSADVVAEAEIHKRLVVAVFDLDEPNRTTVLLRFFEDLPPRTIAERMGVPVETVRTRIKRALAALRDRLDGSGGRDAWIAAIAPLLTTKIETGGTAAAAGGTVMAGKTIAAVVLLGAAAGFAGGRLSSLDAAPAQNADLERRVEALESARSADSGRASSSASGRRIAGAVDRQDDLERRVLALEGEVAAGAKRTTDLADRIATARSPDADARALDGRTTDELLTEIRDLTHSSWANKADERAGYARVFRACETLLSRELKSAQRTETLTAKGTGLRIRGELPESESVLREAISVGGAASPEGKDAACQLAWTLFHRGDARAGAELFLGVARQPDTQPGSRAALHRLAADFLANAGDVARAREEYRALVDEFGASDEKFLKQVAERARKALEDLDQGGVK